MWGAHPRRRSSSHWSVREAIPPPLTPGDAPRDVIGPPPPANCRLNHREHRTHRARKRSSDRPLGRRLAIHRSPISRPWPQRLRLRYGRGVATGHWADPCHAETRALRDGESDRVRGLDGVGSVWRRRWCSCSHAGRRAKGDGEPRFAASVGFVAFLGCSVKAVRERQGAEWLYTRRASCFTAELNTHLNLLTFSTSSSSRGFPSTTRDPFNPTLTHPHRS